MPIVRAPDGQLIRFPDEMPREEIGSILLRAYPDAMRRAPRPEPELGGDGFLRQAADLPLGAVRGGVQGLGMLSSAAFGAGSKPTEALGKVEDFLQGLMSAQAKRDQQEIARIMAEAEDAGVAEQLKAAFEAFKVAPLDFTAQALGTAAPVIAAGLVGGVPGAVAAGGLSTLMGAGVVKGAIYDATLEELTAMEVPPETAAQIAEQAQAYGGENLDQILIGAGLGFVAGRAGVEPAAIRALSNKILGKAAAKEAAAGTAEQVAKETLERQAGRGLIGGMTRTAGVEAGTEAVQAGQEQLAANLALRRQGLDVPLGRGVVFSGGLEALAGGALGAPVGGIETSIVRERARRALGGVSAEDTTDIADVADRLGVDVEELQALLTDTEQEAAPEAARKRAAPEVTERAAPDRAQPAGGPAEAPPLGSPGIAPDTKLSPEAEALLAATTFEPVRRETREPAAPEVTEVAAPEVAAPTEPVANKTFFDSFEIAKQAPLRKRLEGKPLGSPEVTAELQQYASNPRVKQATKDLINDYLAGSAPGTTAVAPEVTKEVAVEVAATPEVTEEVTAAPEVTEEVAAAPEVTEEVVAAPEATPKKAAAKRRKETSAEKKEAAVKRIFIADQRSSGRIKPDLNQVERAAVAAEKEELGPVSYIKREGKNAKKDTRMSKEGLERISTDLAPELVLDENEQRVAADVETRRRINTEISDVDAQLEDLQELSNSQKEGAPLNFEAQMRLARLRKEEQNLKAQKEKLVKQLESRNAAVDKVARKKDAAKERADSRVAALVTAMEIAADYGKGKSKQAAEETLAHPSVTPEERAQAEKLFKRRRFEQLPTASRAKAKGETNDALSTITTAQEGLADIKETGTPFEKLVATRLSAALGGLGIQVKLVEDPDLDMEEGIARDTFMSGDQPAAGLYDDATQTVYLNGMPGMGGLDNITFLHEVYHAATVRFVDIYNQEVLNNVPREESKLTPKQLALIDALYEFQIALEARVKERIANGTASEAEIAFNGVGAFSDLRELIAYGNTHSEMQRILLGMDPVDTPQLKATLGATLRNALSQFVSALRKLFNIPDDKASAFDQLAILTDALLDETKTLDALPASEFSAYAARLKSGDALKKKVYKSEVGSTVDAAGDLANLARGSKERARFLKSLASSIGYKLEPVLAALTTRDLMRWIGDKSPNLETANDLMYEAERYRNKKFTKVRDTYQKYASWAKKNRDAYLAAKDVVYLATLADVDPSPYSTLDDAINNDSQMKELVTKLADPNFEGNKASVKGQITKRKELIRVVYKAWEKAGTYGPAGQKMFVELKEQYSADLEEQFDLLRDNIKSLGLEEGDLKEALDNIESQYKQAKGLSVYFPLVRYGKFWVKVGKGANREFYMFEDVYARDAFLDVVAKEEGKSIEQLRQYGSISFGKGTDEFRKQFEGADAAGKMLRKLYGLIESGKAGDKETLKDSVFQMYLMSLPGGSSRKRYMTRKGVTGFNTDPLRNYLTTESTAINELTRLRYKKDIELKISAARDAVGGTELRGGMPLAPIINEIDKRVKQEFTYTPDAIADALASLGTKGVFFYMMTAPRTALIQLTQLQTTGFPILATRYGRSKTLAVAKGYMKVYDSITGTKNKVDANGEVVTEWGWPTVANSKRVKNHKHSAVLKRAFEQMDSEGAFTTGYVTDVLNEGKLPTVERTTQAKALGFVSRFMSGAFTNSERLAREIMGMSTFELAYEKALSEGKTEEAAYDEAINAAWELTYEGLFDYSQFNKARMTKYPSGRIATQFMTYPMQMTSYLIRNFYNAVRMHPDEGVRKQAFEQLLITLMATGAYAGAVGLPLYGAIVGVLKALTDEFGDEDEFNPLTDSDADLWFRTEAVPKWFGSWEQAVEMGPISALTGVNIGSGLSLDGLWFRDDSPSASSVDFVQGVWERLGGPLLGGAEQLSRGFDYFNEGEYNRAMAAWSPAMFRGLVNAYREEREGYKTAQGYSIEDAEFFTWGKNLSRTLGFQNTEIAERQRESILRGRVIAEARQKRGELLDAYYKAIEDLRASPGDEKIKNRIKKIMAGISEFNGNFPPERITGDTLNTSIKNRATTRALSVDGLAAPKSWMPYIDR